MNTIRRIVLLWLLAPLAVVPGCGDDYTRRYDAAILALEDGRNDAALNDARSVIYGSSGVQRERASYLAGLAASRLGQNDEARQYLQTATRSNQSELAGKAYVQLGLVEQRMGDQLEAARNYEQASTRLHGEDQSRALLAAAEAYQSSGRTVDARRCLSRTRMTGNESAKAAATSRLEITGYTIQFGSFSSRGNAETRARQVEQAARRANLGPVRVRESMGSWKVQAGTFANRQQAGRALQRLGRADAVVMQLQG